jgi:tetratricopeptide (TPR) repeat protein
MDFWIRFGCALCLLWLSGCATLPTTADLYAQHMRLGDEASDERQHRRALREFRAAAALNPDLSAPHIGQAQAHFAMGDYAAARDAAHAALRLDADALAALSLSWAARLEGSEGAQTVRDEVRSELEAELANDPIDAERLLTVYQGYRFLRDKGQRAALVRRLAAMALESPLRDEVMGALFGEMLEQRDDADIAPQLSRDYLTHFPNGPQIDSAARAYLRHLGKAGDDAAKAWALQQLRDGGAHARLLQGIAEWAIQQQMPLPGLAARLLAVADGWRHPTDPRDDPLSPLVWRSSANYWRYLAARMAIIDGDDAAGRKLLEKLQAQGIRGGGVYFALGRLALRAGDRITAERLLVRALHITPQYAEAQELLDEIIGAGRDARAIQRLGSEPWFRDVTAAAGLEEVTASRVAWGDVNGNGLPDLLLDGHQLWLNHGDGAFIDDSKAWGLATFTEGNGGLLVDINNDGLLDIVATSRAGVRIWMQHPRGFVEASEAWLGELDTRYAEALAAGDWNGDGWPDIYVARYERPAVTRAICARDRLLINVRGERFHAVPELDQLADEPLCGRGVTWSDLDGDAQQEIVVANYRLDPNLFWRRGAQGGATEQAQIMGVRGTQKDGYFGHSIGVVAGDLDGDRRLDLLITNLAHPRSLRHSDLTRVLEQTRTGIFKDRFARSGLQFDETNSDPVLADFDNDGDLDLFVTSIYRGRTSRLYLNDGRGHFTDRSWVADARVENGWGAAAADFDRDGDLDLVVASSDGVRLLRNEINNDHFIGIRLSDRACNRFGIGAQLTLKGGDRGQLRELAAGRGTGSQDDLIAHFGVGDQAGPFEVKVATLCGDQITVRGVLPGRYLTIPLP